MAITQAKKMRSSCTQMLAMLEAGLVESHLRNLNHGHLDSVGWLQQRPSMGWKYAKNIVMAAWDFLQRAKRADKRGQSAGRLAQAVQRSKYPGKYDLEFKRANRILLRAVPRCR